MNKVVIVALIAAASTALVQTGEAASRLSRPAQRGLVFAEQRCAACHAVRANGISANPEAPPWEDIANRPGTTRATLRTFLRDSHNYPDAMNFRVDRQRIRDLAEYMVSLQKPGYRPVM